MSEPRPDALPPLPDDVVAMLNERRGGLNELLGLTFVAASRDELVAELTVTPAHLQPYGLVHGGVYAAMIETLASTGAALTALARGQHTVGLENSTSFLRGVREGKLVARAVPLTRGRRTQVWEVTISDDAQRVVAVGRVRLLSLAHGDAIAGAEIRFGFAEDPAPS